MKTKDVTPKEYSKWYGCSLQYIGKCVRAGKVLPYVESIKKWSRFYLLVVPEDLNAETFEEIYKTKAALRIKLPHEKNQPCL